jgi:hypothetical protein
MESNLPSASSQLLAVRFAPILLDLLSPHVLLSRHLSHLIVQLIVHLPSHQQSHHLNQQQLNHLINQLINHLSNQPNFHLRNQVLPSSLPKNQALYLPSPQSHHLPQSHLINQVISHLRDHPIIQVVLPLYQPSVPLPSHQINRPPVHHLPPNHHLLPFQPLMERLLCPSLPLFHLPVLPVL